LNFKIISSNHIELIVNKVWISHNWEEKTKNKPTTSNFQEKRRLTILMNQSNVSSDGPSKTAETSFDVNPQLLSAMLAAIEEYPEAAGLTREQVLSICEQAIRQETCHDKAWLLKRLASAKSGEQLLPALDPGGEPTADKARPSYREVVVSQASQPTSQEEWERILDLHGQWIETVLHPNKEVSFGRANLTEADLRDFDLSGVDLRGAILNGANLEGCCLRKANLATALLRNARLQGACLEAAKLRRADLSGALVEGADFRQADIRLIVQEGLDFSTALNVEDSIR